MNPYTIRVIAIISVLFIITISVFPIISIMKISSFDIIYISKVFYTLNAMIVIRQLIGKRSDIKLYNQSRKTFYVSKSVFGVIVFYSLFNVALFIKGFCN